jgi:hypothetical protein
VRAQDRRATAPKRQIHADSEEMHRLMGPLDLRAAAPRAPRARLAGALFLPRSIDKVRATFPGGNLGDYAIEGFTEMMLEEFGITLGRVNVPSLNR